MTKHVISAESDFGAGRIYGFDSSAHASEKAAFDKIASALAPLGIEAMPGEGSPESDLGPMTRNGMAWAWLGHDGTHYFDLQHHAEDTLDKIDTEALAPNVAANTAFRPEERRACNERVRTCNYLWASCNYKKQTIQK